MKDSLSVSSVHKKEFDQPSSQPEVDEDSQKKVLSSFGLLPEGKTL